MDVLSGADFKEMPWKNGGGVTLELVRAPHPNPNGNFKKNFKKI